uniref:Angiomotin_C domain-containing protein n=2 Tax=Steinernema glaseri TaxID=37863 RepID=A0A1I7ZN69_9BILA
MDGEKAELLDQNAARGTPRIAEAGRSWSIEPAMGEVGQNGGLLKNLLQEATSTNRLDAEDAENNEEQVQSMIDNYLRQMATSGGDERRYHRPSAYSAPPMSHSQPCLFTAEQQQKMVQEGHMQQVGPQMSSSVPRPQCSTEAPPEYREESSSAGRVAGTNTQRIIHALREENGKLRQQVELLGKRAAKLQQLELAYERIEKDYEEVVGQRQQQDNLEAAAMAEMEERLARTTNENLLLRQHINFLSHQQSATPHMDHVDQVAKLNMFINELMLRNKELQERDERQRIEIEAQRVTLEEQRTHIDILEKAVRNAQERISKKEQQAVDAAAVVDRANHLQKLVDDLSEEKTRRDEEIKRERAQFEMELTQQKMKVKDSVALGLKKSGGEEALNRLKKTVHQRDEKIAHLERTVIDLEKKLREQIRNNQSEHEAGMLDLTEKVQKLELEKAEKERMIGELLEEKNEQRRALDARLRLMEQERSSSSFDAAMRMEDLRQKIADRRGWSSGMRMRPRPAVLAHARTSSNGVSTLAIDPDALGEHQRAFSGPSILRNGPEFVYRMHLGEAPKEELPVGEVRTAAEYVAERNFSRFPTTGGSCSSNTSSVHSKSSSEAEDDSPRYVKKRHQTSWDV